MWCIIINFGVFVFNLAFVNYFVVDKIFLIKVGRRLYIVRYREFGVERFIIC